MRVSAGMYSAGGGASITRIEPGRNVDKPHAASANSMQLKLPTSSTKATTLNDFIPQLPPPTAAIEQGEARMIILFQS